MDKSGETAGTAWHRGHRSGRCVALAAAAQSERVAAKGGRAFRKAGCSQRHVLVELQAEALAAKYICITGPCESADLALAKFEEANKCAPNWGRLHLEWGKALRSAGRTDEARKQFAQAASLDLFQADSAKLANRTARHG